MASKSEPPKEVENSKALEASKDEAQPGQEDAGAQQPKFDEEAASQQHHDAEKAKSDDESLTTILDPRQRTELTILLAAATATMREEIAANFDASMPMPGGGGADSNGARPASQQKKKQPQTEDEKMMATDPSTADVAAYDRERKLMDARAKELSAPKMRELRDAALEWFDAWRAGVIGRVGEVMNSDSKEAAKKAEQEGEAHKAEPSKGPAQDRKVEDKPASTDHKATEQAEEDALRTLFPPINTPLAKLDQSKRALILHSVLLLLISLEHYPAPSRILLLYLTASLRLPFSTLTKEEAQTAQGLLHAANELSGDAETKAQAEANERNRRWKVRWAAAAGAAVVGITGGMAAPLVAAGVGSVMGGLGLGATTAAGYLGSVAGSSLLVGGLFGAYGGRMTSKMMDQYAREVQDFAFVPLRAGAEANDNNITPAQSKDDAAEDAEGKSAPQDRRLRVTIAISGWLTEKEEVVKPWRVLGHGGSEAFALRWELEALMNLGHAIETMLSSAAWGYAQKELIARSIFADLMGAMWPLGLLQVARVVDNPFSVAKARAEKAGAVLADALVNRAQGERPVTLLGYSLGARVIYSCLLTLAARRAFGLVEHVVLIGAPLPSDAADWRVLRTAVAGRLVNVFSANDYVLGFLYRTSSVQLGVAGLQRIEGVPGVENVDVSDVVSGHLRYRHLVGRILRTIGFEDLDLAAVQREEDAFKVMLEEEQKARDRMIEKVPKKIPTSLPESVSVRFGGKKAAGTEKAPDPAQESTEEAPTKGGAKPELSAEDAEKEAQSMEKSVQEKTDSSYMQYLAEVLRLGQTTGATSAASQMASARYPRAASATSAARDPQGTIDAAKDSPYATFNKYQPYVMSASTYARQHWPFSTNSSAKASQTAKDETSETPSAPDASKGSKPAEGDAASAAAGRSYLEMASDSWRGWGGSKEGSVSEKAEADAAATSGSSYLGRASDAWRSMGKGKEDPKASSTVLGGKTEDNKSASEVPAEKAGEKTESSEVPEKKAGKTTEAVTEEEPKKSNQESAKASSQAPASTEEQNSKAAPTEEGEGTQQEEGKASTEAPAEKAEEETGAALKENPQKSGKDEKESDDKDGQGSGSGQKSYMQSGASMLGLSK